MLSLNTLKQISDLIELKIIANDKIAKNKIIPKKVRKFAADSIESLQDLLKEVYNEISINYPDSVGNLGTIQEDIAEIQNS